MASIGIIGAGTWGTALARMLCNAGHAVTVWSAIPEEIDELSGTRRQRNLPNMVIPEGVAYTKDLSEACAGKEILLFAVPSVYVRSTVRRAAPYIGRDQIIVDVAKGIEADTLMTMTEIIRDEVGEGPSVVALSGPTHAEEVALDLPTTIVSACEDLTVAERVQAVFTTPVMRVYTNTDVKGVELCGALKNIIALASGISIGLGYGDNTKAALITRGLAEMERLGAKMGCLPETFSGLAGMGDLIVTATSRHSRNNRCGFLIGQGCSVADAVKQVGMVVEGINAIPAAVTLAERYNVEMPIVQAVDRVIHRGESPLDAVRSLMGRDSKTELRRPVLDPDYEDEVIRPARRVITYGTFDQLNYGHIGFLRRARALGDHLTVAVSTDRFAWSEKHRECRFNYEQRKAFVEAIGCVDRVIPEDNLTQKLSDIEKYRVDVVVMGEEWKGRLNDLEATGVEVVYLPRTV